MTIPFISSPCLAEIPHIRHGFFTRSGGVSNGIYASLNAGPGSNDDTAAVTENRRRIAATLGLAPPALRSLYQIHSTDIVEVTDDLPDAERPKGDAMVCQLPALGLGILTADCIPILFADRHNKIAAAAHAGWKGALGGVMEATVAEMELRGSKREDIVAAIGPAIAQRSYEVGADYREIFVASNTDYADYFVDGARDDHYQFDLPGFVEDRLNESGLVEVENLALDTYSDETRFFSYRRTTHHGEADYGRQISVICLI